MNDLSSWHSDMLAEKTVAALTKNKFTAAYIKDRQQAIAAIMAMIPENATVGIGGSWTIQELGLSEALEQRGNTVYNHNKPGLSPDESMELRRKELTADVFLTGTNAVTLDGKLVNIDGAGNRVAAMTFGPKQVIVITGTNKIVQNVADAESRIKLYAAPINNKRLSRPNPCVATGCCMDCQGDTRICNVTSIMHKRPLGTPTHIIIIGEQLGF